MTREGWQKHEPPRRATATIWRHEAGTVTRHPDDPRFYGRVRYRGVMAPFDSLEEAQESVELGFDVRLAARAPEQGDLWRGKGAAGHELLRVIAAEPDETLVVERVESASQEAELHRPFRCTVAQLRVAYEYERTERRGRSALRWTREEVGVAIDAVAAITHPPPNPVALRLLRDLQAAYAELREGG